MSTPYVGEIRVFAGSYAPTGWALCDGSELQISDNEVLFQLIGTTYGGDGVTTFNLPDLRGRIPLGAGSSAGLTTRVLGETGGAEAVLVLPTQLPAHAHGFAAGGAATTSSPAGNVYAQASVSGFAAPGGSTVNLAVQTLDTTGSNQPHQNMPPFLGLTFMIAVAGVFPSSN
ncbi:phage tail protein [Gryllotalpicola koreensis]|uniref:Tail fiber protein n=1 Tax=Gryllotalpicola koreensis TaxID=993086 RepID=A0ABP7ZQB0_9MICO